MNIYPFPTHDNNNPFLWELYRRIDGVAPTPLWQISKPGIIHIHWSSQLYGSRFLLKSIASLATNFFRLWYLKQHGCKIIWTMHNLSAHDFPHPWIDWMGRKFLFVLSDAIIIQQKSAQESLSRRFPRKRIVHIPLGNYIGLYGNWYSQEHRDIVLLSFGLVRPYKKIDEIIRVVRQSGQNIRLCIVGKASDAYAKNLKTLIGDSSSIAFENRFVPDNEVAGLLGGADYSVFWFDDSVLTSSGIILSLSYGLPVIARKSPATEKIHDGRNGYLFTNADTLLDILLKLPHTRKLEHEDIIGTVRNDSQEYVAEQFMNLCKSVF